MGGTSEKAQGATDLQGLLKNYYAQIQGEQGFKAPNVTANYETPFDYKSMSGELDKSYKGSIDKINRTAEGQIQQGQGDTAARMASQGITGGSVLNSAVNSNRTDVNKSRFNSLSDLATGRAGQNINLMNLENQNSFQNNQAKQQQYNQEVRNLMSKYGLLSNTTGQMGANVGNLDDTTFWDDLFAGLNTLGPLAGAAATIATGGAAAPLMAVAGSDIRFKENISKVGISPRGINIYEFNYKGNLKRFRGAIAQENPEASIEINGMLYLDYSKLDVKFEAI